MATKRMKLHKWKDIVARTFSPEEQRQMRAEVLRDSIEITLQALRELSGKTQVEVAAILEKTQGEMSKIERRRDLLVSTLREYVEALGGHLELRAVFDDRSITINPMLTDEKSAA